MQISVGLTPVQRDRMKHDDVKIIEKKTAHDGYFRLDAYRLKHRLFEGGWSDEMSREVFERGHAASAVLFDPQADRLVLIEQFRIGAYTALESPWFDGGFSPWLIEIVAGIIEEGEDPEEVVRRESVEESGCEILDLVPIGHYLVSPGASSESMFAYCGRVDSSNAGGIRGLDHEHEDIRVLSVPAGEVFQWLDEGRIYNSTALVCLQWFRIHYDELKARWSAEAAP